jgi:signal transduction histidine kinase/FixJ family two-component response regulator
MMQPGVYFPDIVWEGIRRNQFIIEGAVEDWYSRRLEFHHRCEGYMEQQLASGQWVRMSERRTPWGGVISMRADLTPLREHEIELRIAKEQAETATLEKSDFLARVSHELRTPMNGVLSLAQALIRTSLTSRQQWYVETIVSSARALAKLLDDILDVSRIERGQLQVETVPVPLHDIFDQIMRLFEPIAESKGLQLRTRIDEMLPDSVMADPLRLRQILINLVNNALKFTSSGFVELRTRASGPGRLRIEVADSGPGIAEEHRAALFQPFSRIEAVAAGDRGAGLGLAISKQLAEAMGGAIGMEGGASGGSIFTLDLSVACGSARGGEAELAQTEPCSGLKVLVVDDDTVNLLVAETLLQQMGHVVETCRSGTAALDRLDRKRFDVVLLDIAMPGEDGLTTARKIRGRRGGETGTPPILAMTAKVMTESLEAYRSAGMAGVVPKPIIFEQLDRALAEACAPVLPEPLVRMRTDVGTERYCRILRESSKVVAEACQEAETYRAGGSGKALAAVLHRLSPTAQMLGLADLSTEASIIEDRLNRDADVTDTLRLSGLLTQSMGRIEAWIAHRADEVPAQ